MAFYGWPISQCQSPYTPLQDQLHSGIRVLDVRLAVVEGRLISYHGIFPQRTPFQTILGIVHAFLIAPPTSRETLVMSIKQEDFTRTPLPLFSRLVHDEIMNGPGGRDMWFLENRIPKLGEVRGRVIMLSRFGGDGSGWEGGLEGLGIHPTAWPDSEKEGFTWTLKGTLVRTHDWYSIPSFLQIPEKVELATQILLPPPNDPPFPVLNITFFSAASVPLALPPLVAKGFGWPKWGLGIEGVNGRVGEWLLHQLSGDGGEASSEKRNKQWRRRHYHERGADEDVRIRGWAFMDYYAEPNYAAVVPLLVECNYRGRKKGEEGWE
ncbi:PLC-like phosphodiesterase [Trametes sanguinea]|nr:PLC-like phosphodiesterase [Trametes sanguinea]